MTQRVALLAKKPLSSLSCYNKRCRDRLSAVADGRYDLAGTTQGGRHDTIRSTDDRP